MIAWTAKDPAEELSFSWTVPLETGDTVDTFTASVASGTVTITAQSATTTVATIDISGGADGELAYITLTAITDLGYTHRQSAVLPILDRAAALLASFRLRYPAFAAIEDGPIGFWLVDATTQVDTRWAASSRDAGKCAWAAHKMVETGVLASAVPAGLTSFKSGTFSATVSDGLASLTGIESTVYGREFANLRRASLGGPRLAWTPPTSLY